MVSGYCKCSFPASMKCPKCGEKLCGNCYPKHECEAPKPVEVVETKSEQSEAVKKMVRKPYGPRVKK